ncbi:MAG: pantetheine-phosphate adenylyltransferase [Prevotella sp.]|jgi:pantetheine-phosphate adenylyltransferase|nr:pantetheine-phosphate adenylyltransferase [Prevotella sp.]
MKGLFVGSFDPFTIGHASVVRRVLPLFDEVVIGVGHNISKNSIQTPEERVSDIRRLYADEKKIRVVEYDGLTVDLARQVGASFLIKGVRSVKDFEYERDQADINRMLTGIETILIMSEPHLAAVSSSLVRELKALGKDITPFVPK